MTLPIKFGNKESHKQSEKENKTTKQYFVITLIKIPKVHVNKGTFMSL